MKYYMHIFFYCIGISVIKSWLLYRRHMQEQSISKKDQFTLLAFHTEIAESLRNAGKVPNPLSWSRRQPLRDSPVPQKRVKRRPPTTADPSNDIRLDQMSHFPVFTEKQNCFRNWKTGIQQFAVPNAKSFSVVSKCVIVSATIMELNEIYDLVEKSNWKLFWKTGFHES